MPGVAAVPGWKLWGAAVQLPGRCWSSLTESAEIFEHRQRIAKNLDRDSGISLPTCYFYMNTILALACKAPTERGRQTLCAEFAGADEETFPPPTFRKLLVEDIWQSLGCFGIFILLRSWIIRFGVKLIRDFPYFPRTSMRRPIRGAPLVACKTSSFAGSKLSQRKGCVSILRWSRMMTQVRYPAGWAIRSGAAVTSKNSFFRRDDQNVPLQTFFEVNYVQQAKEHVHIYYIRIIVIYCIFIYIYLYNYICNINHINLYIYISIYTSTHRIYRF